MSWPEVIAAARKAHQSTASYIIALHNDPKAHTLSGQSIVPPNAIVFDMGGGDPNNQSPLLPQLNAVQGTSGQFGYSYPLAVPPGPPGTTPSLALSYSSGATSERHSITSRRWLVALAGLHQRRAVSQ
jgi:hypothetical protein